MRGSGQAICCMTASGEEAMVHMKQRNDGTQNCAGCGFMRTYDYGNRIHYCDHEDRIDDMGKLGVGELSEERPGWCPLREKTTIGPSGRNR